MSTDAQPSASKSVPIKHPPRRQDVLECFRHALTEMTLAGVEREIDICKTITGHWFTGTCAEEGWAPADDRFAQPDRRGDTDGLTETGARHRHKNGGRWG